VRLTSPAKSVADGFKFRGRIGLEAAIDAGSRRSKPVRPHRARSTRWRGSIGFKPSSGPTWRHPDAVIAASARRPARENQPNTQQQPWPPEPTSDPAASKQRVRGLPPGRRFPGSPAC
jgi:hypothetical protein